MMYSRTFVCVCDDDGEEEEEEMDEEQCVWQPSFLLYCNTSRVG